MPKTAPVSPAPEACGPADFCAIDFGTSNSAIAVPQADGAMALVPLEGEALTMPTAVFYLAEGPDLPNLPRLYGRAAIAAYVEGSEGRLMRSMKSVLGSNLMEQHTDIGAGRSVSFADVIASYLRHLLRRAEAHAGRGLRRAVL
ncbi:MAG TPA: heat-shock protein, partial [Burkholderiaceae bacterium]|nr:heat-shock protein [Burkholderiaceae bacterium]